MTEPEYKPKVSEIHIYWKEKNQFFTNKQNLDYEFDDQSFVVKYTEAGKIFQHVFTRLTIDEIVLIEIDESALFDPEDQP